MGCSDYIVRMRNPSEFMNAFEEVNHLGKVRRSDRKVVFLPHAEDNFTKANMLNILSIKETRFLANILFILPVIDSELCTKYDLATHKYVGLDHQVDELFFMDRWNSCSSTFENNANLFPHDMTNQHGKVLKVASVWASPFVILDIDPSVEPSGRDGIQLRILDEFCRWTNCSIKIQRSSYVLHPMNTELNKNDTGLGVIGDVMKDQADFATSSLSSWYLAYRVLDFSVPYIRVGMTCMVPMPRLLAKWEMPYRPFSWYIWLALITTFVSASVVFIIAKDFSTDKVFLTTFGIMLTQSYNDVAATWRVRSVTGWLLLTGLVLDNAYSGGLASILTIPAYEKPINTAQDIIDSKMYWGALYPNAVFAIQYSSAPMDKQLVSQFKVFTGDDLKKSGRKDLALAFRRLPSDNFTVRNNMTKELLLGLTMMREDLFFEFYVLMMRKSSPYTQKFSEIILRLQDYGLILAWETQLTRKYLNNEGQIQIRQSRLKNDVDSMVPINLFHVVVIFVPSILYDGVFILYAVGVTISAILFILEIVAYKRHKSTVQH